MLIQVMQNKIPIDKYIITKQLRDDYKNPEQIAHRVLADRMEQRDAGNKPQVGDRLSFIFVANRSGKQGDRIEQIDYVKENKLKPDVDFYITNQIQKPVAQLFALAIEELEGYTTRTVHYSEMYKGYLETMDEEEATLKVLAFKEKELDKLLFTKSQYLMRHKRGPMDMFIQR
jgi:DNA polymerase elongation subunit (family B)